MKRNAATRAIVTLMLAALVAPAWADRHDNRDNGHRGGRHDGPPAVNAPRDFRGQDNHDRRYYEDRGYRYDGRYGHNRYYPPRGYVAPTLPRYYRVIPYRGIRYYYNAGIWYRHGGVGFTVIVPPLGIIVPALPPYYTTLYVDSTPYYYADGVYYVWRRNAPGYEVVAAPDDSRIDADASLPEELYIYPKEGQGEQQQADDRFECHQWSVDQTGYDPSQPGGNVPADEHTDKREQYLHAMTACLEGRGYSVK